jgi:hypothetical protein
MKTNPWFSTEDAQAELSKPIHHNNTACKSGAKIGKNHSRYGTDNRPLCKECTRLNEIGE